MTDSPAIGSKTITVIELTCQRCGYKWVPRKTVDRVRMCPDCKSTLWDERKKEPKGRR